MNTIQLLAYCKLSVFHLIEFCCSIKNIFLNHSSHRLIENLIIHHYFYPNFVYFLWIEGLSTFPLKTIFFTQSFHSLRPIIEFIKIPEYSREFLSSYHFFLFPSPIDFPIGIDQIFQKWLVHSTFLFPPWFSFSFVCFFLFHYIFQQIPLHT